MAHKFKGTVQIDGNISLPQESASKVLQISSGGILQASSTTNTELGYLSGVTSSIQTQLGNKVNTSAVGAANGVASLDSGGKVPVSQLPNSVMEFQGVWNASTNSPTLVDGTGNTGDVYRVNVAGTQDLGSGSQTFVVGDYVIYDAGGVWRLAHSGADAVVSVNGSSGVVTVNAINELTGDVTTSAASGSQSKVATIANAAVTGAKIASDTITNTNINSAAAIAYSKLNLSGSIVNADVASGAAIAYSKLNLSGSIVNADVASGAAIVYSKLDLSSSIVNADISSSAAIAYSKLNLSGSIVNADVATGAAIARSKLASGTANRIIVNDGSGVLSEAAALTDGQLLIGSTGAAPVAAAITAGTGITVTNGAGSITIAATSSGSAGDINETSFSAADGQGTAANVTGFAFANATVRSFKALVSVSIDATADLFESFEILGVQKGSGWDIAVSSTGDTSGIVFSITNAGQIQYTSTSVSGFVSNTMKFRAITTTV